MYKFKEKPSHDLRGFGIIINVELKFTKYTIKSGNEATVGKSNLCLQRKSKTSSAKPNKTIQQIDKSAASISIN